MWDWQLGLFVAMEITRSAVWFHGARWTPSVSIMSCSGVGCLARSARLGEFSCLDWFVFCAFGLLQSLVRREPDVLQLKQKYCGGL